MAKNRSNLATLWVALMLAAVVDAQQQIGCFVQGECLDSFYVGITPADSPESCLDACVVSTQIQLFNLKLLVIKVCIIFPF